VLLVDDEAVIRLLCTVNLEDAGFEVEAVGNGAAAIAEAHRERPDLIVLDLRMPEMDGWSVLGALGVAYRDDPIPVIVLSAWASPDEAQRVVDQGAEFMAKPFEPDELVDRVRSTIARSRGSA
jgi:DNA-binding response OmpR family regulator